MGGYNSSLWNSFQWGQPGTPLASLGQFHVSDIVYSALRKIRVVPRPGVGYSMEQFNDAVLALNPMLDSWNIEKLMVFVRLRSLYNLVASQQTYKIGNSSVGKALGFGSPDWDTSPDQRPDAIPAGSVILQIIGQPTEIVIEPLTWEQWQGISIKNIQATYPIKFWYDYQYPYGNVNVWPVPTQGNQFGVYIPQLLKQAFVNATDVVIIPQGYVRALIYNLAVEVADQFENAVLTPNVERLAMETKANVKRSNTRFVRASGDAAVAMRGGWFNFWTGYYEP